MTDVNAEFATTKMQQITNAADPAQKIRSDIAAGKLKPLGGNRFAIVGGWDNGEIIRIDLAAIEAGALSVKEAIQASHGLDVKANGDITLYLKDAPAWHSLGTVVAGGLTSMSEILAASGLAWTTDKRRVAYMPDFSEDIGFGAEADDPELNRALPRRMERTLNHVPEKYVTVRSDTLAPLGVVGSRYEPIHNHQAFLFLEELFGDQLMICETAGSMEGGSSTFISAEIPGELLVDPAGIADRIRMFLMIRNSHDGSSPLVCVVTPWRPVCKNTERFAIRDAHTSWYVRHTASAKTRVKEASRALGLTSHYYERWLEEETKLVQTDFSRDDVEKLIEDVWGEVTEDATLSKKTRRGNLSDTLQALFGMESERVGRNAYAAERAVTTYLDHGKIRRGKATPLELLGTAIIRQNETLDSTKSKAHKLLLSHIPGWSPGKLDGIGPRNH